MGHEKDKILGDTGVRYVEYRGNIGLFWGKEAQVQKFCGKDCIGGTWKIERWPAWFHHGSHITMIAEY